MREGLTKAYELVRCKVSPNQLLLDPTNPRLITNRAQDRDYGSKEIASDDVQAYVLDLVLRKEHAVRQLIASIQAMGFIGGLHEVIVKRLPRGERFLVLEGNRRTAALQYLLGRSSELRPDVRESIKQIEVQEFIYHPNAHHSEEHVIDVLLGAIHIDGPKEWGALEKSYYIHKSYMRELDSKKFRFTFDVAQRVGETFKMSAKAVRSYLRICRVHEQLRGAGFAVDPKHYTLIGLAVKTRALAHEFFELDDETCEMSDKGLERFAALCIGDNRPIHNPKLFDRFVYIYTEGTELECQQAIDGEQDLEGICARIRTREKRRGFREDLEYIRSLVGQLRLSDFRGTEGEKQEIRRIHKLINKTLWPLASKVSRQKKKRS